MRQFILFVWLFSVCASYGQINQGGKPYSYNNKSALTLKATSNIPVYNTKELNIQELLDEDNEFPTPYRYSVFEDVNIPIKSLGIKTELPDNIGNIWRYKFEGENAKSLQVYFDKFNLPEGAKLFVYNSDYSNIRGAYTHINNNSEGSLMLSAFEESEIIVEYYEPHQVEFNGEIVIGAIGKGYKEITEKSTSVDDIGLLNVNCPEGEDWQNEKHAVCKLTFRIGKSGYTCTGSLINNTRNDGTPYFMTANHCIDNDEAAKTVIGYFNFETVGCSDLLKSDNQTLSGASFMTTGEESDYTLLKFDNPPPVSYQPFYAGWDVTGTAGKSATGIHHPGGDVKKISVGFEPPESYEYKISWEDDIITPAHSHWLVRFDLGLTYGGSSGSPLYNESGNFIGQLHGGGDIENFYGKLSHSWRNSNDELEPLKNYLDPENSGIKVLNAYYPYNNKPDPQFYADFTTICQHTPINFMAFSAFDPLHWKWQFTPDAVTYLNGSSSTSTHPFIMFNNSGYYTVSLEATNASATEVTVMEQFILVDSNLNVQALPAINSDSCLCSFDSILINGYGASSFKWQLDEEFTDNFYLVDSMSNPVILKAQVDAKLNKSVQIGIQFTGKHGLCNTQGDLSIQLIGQENDQIENALQIEFGQNGIFSNVCSSVEENEPIPPYTSCTGQDSWCDEYGTGADIVENSVWFYYIAESTSELNLSSKGFDNQVAVYQAETYQDILNGNYNLIGANDDYTDQNYNPIITGLSVEKDKTYWIQVDGSGGGTEGDFYLYIDKATNITKSQNKDSEIMVYPMPSNGIYIFESDEFLPQTPVTVEIYDLSGQKVAVFNNLYPDANTIKIDMTQLKKSVYLSRILLPETVFTTRLIKQ